MKREPHTFSTAQQRAIEETANRLRDELALPEGATVEITVTVPHEVEERDGVKTTTARTAFHRAVVKALASISLGAIALFGHLGAAGSSAGYRGMPQFDGLAGGSANFTCRVGVRKPVKAFRVASDDGDASPLAHEFSNDIPPAYGVHRESSNGTTQSGRDSARAVKGVASAQPVHPTTLGPTGFAPSPSQETQAELADTLFNSSAQPKRQRHSGGLRREPGCRCGLTIAARSPHDSASGSERHQRNASEQRPCCQSRVGGRVEQSAPAQACAMLAVNAPDTGVRFSPAPPSSPTTPWRSRAGAWDGRNSVGRHGPASCPAVRDDMIAAGVEQAAERGTMRPAAAMPGWQTRPLAEAAGRAPFVS